MQTWDGDNKNTLDIDINSKKTQILQTITVLLPQSLPQEIVWPHLLAVPLPNKGQDTLGEETDYNRFPSLKMLRFLKQVEQRIYAKVFWRLEAAKPLLKYLRTHLEALLPPTSQRNWQLDVHDVHGNGAAMKVCFCRSASNQHGLLRSQVCMQRPLWSWAKVWRKQRLVWSESKKLQHLKCL